MRRLDAVLMLGQRRGPLINLKTTAGQEFRVFRVTQKAQYAAPILIQRWGNVVEGGSI